ncbi:hypothetical protein D3C85_1311510 [compost metagenome]
MAEVGLDEGERQIHRCADSRRGPEIAFTNEDGVDIDLDLRISLLHDLGHPPVGGRPLAIKQAGCGEEQRPRAPRGEAIDLRCDTPGPLHYFRLLLDYSFYLVSADQHDGIGKGFFVESTTRFQAHQGVGGDGAKSCRSNPHFISRRLALRFQVLVRIGEDRHWADGLE